MKNTTWVLLILLAFVSLTMACSAPPTPTRVPTPTATLPPPTITPTRLPPTPTLVPTITPIPVPPTPSQPSPTPTRTRVVIVATPKPVGPTATPVPAKPAAPQGQIAYRRTEDGVDRMAIMNVTTGGVTPFVTLGPTMDLTLDGHGTNAHVGEFAPGGARFAYIYAGSPGAANVLKVLDVAAGTDKQLYSSDAGGGLSSPTWSSDGKRLAFIKTNADKSIWSLIIIPSDGTKCSSERFECLIKFGQGENYRGGVSWGKENLLTISYNTDAAPDVYTIYADGQGAVNRTKNPADDIAPVWSLDGTKIAFSSNRDGGKWRIYVMNADGSGVRAVSPGPLDVTPTWSPDGNWIAFSSVQSGSPDIWMVDVHGANMTQLSKGGGSFPAWSR